MQFRYWLVILSMLFNTIEVLAQDSPNTIKIDSVVVNPCVKKSPYSNFFTGISLFPSKACNIKLNLSSGIRVPNLAELSSNGLHEGSLLTK